MSADPEYLRLLTAVRFLENISKTIDATPEAIERVTRKHGWVFDADVRREGLLLSKRFSYLDANGEEVGGVSVPLHPAFRDYAHCVRDWAANLSGVLRTHAAAEFLAEALAEPTT